MWLQGKHVSTFTEASLLALIQGGVGESQQLDYKSAFAIGSDDEKRDLLADATAMANTSGGVVLFGVETERDANGRDTGIPIALPGLVGLNFDAERLKIASMLKDAASPSLTTQIAVKDIALQNGNMIIALGVSRSHLAPHRVAYKGLNRFFRRNQSGNYQPEVAELRRMFLEQHEWTTEAAELADRRADKVRELVYGAHGFHPTLIVHLVPLGRLDQVLDLRGRVQELAMALPPLRASGFNWEYNVDGVRAFTPDRGGPLTSYTQVLRNGTVEFASLGYGEPKNVNAPNQLVYGDDVVLVLRKRLPEVIQVMREKLAVEPPYAVIIRLTQLNNANLRIDTVRTRGGAAHLLENGAIVLPPFIVDDPAAFDQEALNRALDVLWQSAGYPEVPRQPKK